MRKKEKRLVITFHTTADAMAMDALCKKNKAPGRLIPVPREIAAGCGLAWCALPSDQAVLMSLIEDSNISYEGINEVEIYASL